MKKILLILTLLTATIGVANAQWARWGAKAGAGVSMIHDDISSTSPILGGFAGIYVDYGFENAKIAWNTNLYLQFGVNFTRKGGNFQELFKYENELSIREGFYHNYYAQVPVLLGFKFEMPVKHAGHYVNILFGPAFSAGVYGKYRWRTITTYNPQAGANSDNYGTDDKSARNSFSFVNRFDANLIVSVGYHYRHLMLDLVFDYGFIPVRPEEDAIRKIEREQTGNSNYKIEVPGGNLMTVMLSAGFNIPINEKARYNRSSYRRR